jgi:putative redox protein
MVDIYVDYEGDLRCKTLHGPSKTAFNTDAPVDNHGRGESFSPTDLLATALGTCMLTVMGIRAKKEGWDMVGAHAHIQKEMTSTGPRRIARLPTKITLPAERGTKLSAETRATLEHIAHTCPVRLSIHDSIDVPIEFDWEA